MRVSHPHCGSIQPQPKQEEKSEPSADALRASADGASRTQDLANFSWISRKQFSPAVRMGHTHCHPHSMNFKAVIVTMRMKPPAVRVIHPHWTRRELKTARFSSFSIFGALWTRFDCLQYQCLPVKLSKQSIHYSINPWFKASKLGLSFGYIMRGYYSIHYLILSLSTHTHLATEFLSNKESKGKLSSKENKGFISKIRQDRGFRFV